MKSPSIEKITGSDSRSTNGKRGNGRRPGTTLGERVEDRDLELSLFAAAVRRAVKKHKQAGVPISVWEDGQVKIIPPEEIPDILED